MWCTFVLIRDGNVGKYETIKSAILLITHIKSDYLLVFFSYRYICPAILYNNRERMYQKKKYKGIYSMDVIHDIHSFLCSEDLSLSWK